MINVILDQCLERIRTQHATVAECLARYPDCAFELAPLLSMAMALESIPDVTPSANFKETMRAYLLHLPIQVSNLSNEVGTLFRPNHQPSKIN